MIIGRALCLSACLFFASVFAAAQCPKISVSSPSQVDEEQPMTATANINGLDRNLTPTYNWTVSAGTISSGQGTSTITVDTSYTGGQSVTATVQVGGLLPRCNNSASSTTFVGSQPLARKFDEYGPMRLPDEKARLDNFAIEMQNDPTVQGYVIVFTARTSPRGTATARLNTVKSYLGNVRGIDFARIVMVNGGPAATPKTELWIAPNGATPPSSSPPVVKRPQTRTLPSVERPRTQTPVISHPRERRAG